MKASRRGEYRAILAVLVDGPDYQTLSPAAKLVLLTLKLGLGPWQIGVMPACEAVLGERTGFADKQIRAAFAELAAGGWVRVERNVVWIVDGLRYEPSVQHTDSKHVTGLSSYVAGLPRLAIVRDFCAAYPEWAIEGPSEPLPDALPRALVVTEDRRQKTDNRIQKAPPAPDEFEEIWTAYPHPPGDSKALAKHQYLARLREGVAHGDLLAGIRTYARFLQREGREAKYRKQCQTFLSKTGRHWESDYTVTAPPSRPAEIQAPYHRKFRPPPDPAGPDPSADDPRVLALVQSVGRAP